MYRPVVHRGCMSDVTEPKAANPKAGEWADHQPLHRQEMFERHGIDDFPC